MSKIYKDLEAEILFERKEHLPSPKQIVKATVLVKNSRGLFVDINKTYEGFVSTQELGAKQDYSVGDLIEVCVLGEDKNQDGVFRLSIRQIEDEKKWDQLKDLLGQNLELTITKVLRSGIEVSILVTQQTGFIPFGYLDNRQDVLKDKKREDWIGISIPGRIHEFDPGRNKIIIDNKVICDEQREARASEIISSIALGQTLTGVVVRATDFGVFVDIGGLDALIPSSELSWRRFKKPSEVVRIGQTIQAKVFKVEADKKRVALSIKQAEADPWTTLPEDIKTGYQAQAKVVTHADFGVFVEVIPGIEALLHKSNYTEIPEIGSEIAVEVVNLDPAKKRMGVKISTKVSETVIAKPEEIPAAQNLPELTDDNNKELEHV